MLNNFEKIILNFANKHRLFSPSSRIILAVSGGADSVAMLHALSKMNLDIAIAHINHNLRGADSDEDEKFVLKLGKNFGIETITDSVDVKGYAEKNKISIETAARNLRIEKLIQIATQQNYTAIAAAHHKDDNAETIIHRIARGTSYRGLAGIYPSRDINSFTFIRPMLCLSRKEILAYLDSENISYQHDRTNDELVYTRNRIRHLLIPQIQKQCTEPVSRMLYQLSLACQRLNSRIGNSSLPHWQMSESSETAVSFQLAEFSNLTPAVKAELIRRAITSLGCGERNLTSSHYRKIIDIADAAGGTVNLPDNFRASILNNRLCFAKADQPSPQPVKLNIPGQTTFEDKTIEAELLDIADCDIDQFISRKNPDIEWFDADKIIGRLIIRRRQQGDRFTPLGSRTLSKIGDFTKDKHLALIADDEKIIWLANIRPCQQTKITSGTKTILQLYCPCLNTIH